ncbi:hypothetical protein [Candidatus Uabimicrobium amorphum]|uniref:MFS transporter n=1 Tax=Uabimicrobium amorphum TaxID=2596890 RepID=A0A5S9F775_UABAM|nr:hypothetical protein [Candidatus Uabimicrobium amorphum]BBM87399.1 hypothetical protein UABAM_05808 [Candidatus Uabimicrobium amorphum]
MSIDFAKLALILGYADREKIFEAIREEVIVQECGLNKRLEHILYERNILKKESIQSLLWGLFCKRRIKLFPSRVVYCFTDRDDELFLQKVGISFQQLIENVRSKKRFRLENVDSAFPVKDLISATNIHRKLQDCSLQRTLLSILSARGSLKAQYRDLVENIEERRFSISSPLDVQNKNLTQTWSGKLFLQLLLIDKDSEKQKELQQCFATWKDLIAERQIDIRFSEYLFHQSVCDENLLLHAGIALHTLTNIDQIPRVYILHLKSKHKTAINEYLKNHSAKLQNSLQIPLEQMALYTDKQLQQSLFADKKPLDIYKKWKKQQRQKITKSFIPFSVRALDQDLQKQYTAQRRQFKTLPKKDMGNFVAEWSQTQVLPFCPTESFSIKDTPATVKDHTEYISLEKPEVGATGYLSIDATQEEIQFLSNKLEKSLRERKPIKTLLFIIFAASFSMAASLCAPLFQEHLMLLLLPFLLAIWCGRRLDHAKGKLTFTGGLYVFAISSYLAIEFPHYGWLVVQGAGYLYLSVSAWYCLYRWTTATNRTIVLIVFLHLLGFLSSYWWQYSDIESYKEYLPLIHALLCLLAIPLFYIAIPKLSYEDEITKEKNLFNSALVTPFLFGFFSVVFAKISMANIPKISLASSHEDLFSIFAGGIMSGVVIALFHKRSSVLWLRYISFLSIFMFVVSPFVIADKLFDSIFFLNAMLCGLLLPISISLILKNNESSVGETIGYLFLILLSGSLLAETITHLLFYNIAKFFLILSLLAIIHFYIMLIIPSKEIQHIEETRLGGLLRFLG